MNKRQDFINYITVPSCETMAITKIVAELWKHADFRVEILNHLSVFYSRYCYFTELEEQDKSLLKILNIISKKLYLLSIPNLLKEEAMNVIKPMGLDIFDFIAKFEKDYWYEQSKMVDCLCWTIYGTIDKAKSYELYLGNKNLNHISNAELQHIFNAACEFCLEDNIVNLWKNMPKEVQENSFYSENMYGSYDGHLIAYWVSFAQNELPKLITMIKPSDVRNVYSCKHSICKNMLTLSVLGGKSSAMKYFWKKLTDEEKSENKMFWTCLVVEEGEADENEYTDVMCFLLSQLNDKAQQIEVFQKYPERVLNFLLIYQGQQFLLPTCQLMWDFLDKNIYNRTVSRVINENEKTGFTGKYFMELWCNSPMIFKTYFIHYIMIAVYTSPMTKLWNLFRFEDIQCIKLILNDCNVEQKKLIACRSIDSRSLFHLIYSEKLYLFDMLIKESRMSESEIKNVKESTLLEHGDELCRGWIRDDNWKAVEKLLQWGFNTRDEVDTFKARMLSRIVQERSLGMLGSAKWSSFENFINWCFSTDEEIKKFKTYLSPFKNMESYISDIIVDKLNFEFADKFLIWCLQSEKEVSDFKKKLMLSLSGMEMFKKFANKRIFYKYRSVELIAKLTKWFHPFSDSLEFRKKLKDNRV